VTEWRDTEGNFPLDGGSHDRREKWLQWGNSGRSSLLARPAARRRNRPFRGIEEAGSNKSPPLAAALGRTIASSSRSQRGTRLLGPTCGAHFLEKAEGALNQYAVFLPVVAPAKAPIGQQCLRQLGPRLDFV